MTYSKFRNIRKIYDACKGVVKIMTSTKLGSGFFIKLEKGNSPFYCLMSNEHIISKDIIEKKEKIEVFYDKIIMHSKRFFVSLLRNLLRPTGRGAPQRTIGFPPVLNDKRALARSLSLASAAGFR